MPQGSNKMDFAVDDVVVGRFKIMNLVGRGGQAVVYKVVDVKTQQIYALKQYQHVDYMMQEDLAQIEAEAQMLQKIEHKNVLHAFQLIKTTEQYLLVMEFVDGCLMSEFIRQQFPHLVPVESLVDFADLYKKLSPFQEQNDVRYRYHSLIRGIVQDKLKQNAPQRLAPGFTLDIKDYEMKNSQEYKNVSKPLQVVTEKPRLQVSYEEVSNVKQIEVTKTPQSKMMRTLPDLDTATKAPPTYQESVEFLFAQLLEVLCELQRQQVMHRDLKPENVMITRTLQLKLIDFGYCKEAKTAKTLVGTPGFLAPEMHTGEFKDRAYSSKVDIWAAGALFYSMLYGYCPFLVGRYIQFDILQALKGLYLPTDIFGTTYIDKKFVDLIERAFTVDPQQRPDALQLRDLYYKSAKTQLLQSVKTVQVIERVMKVALVGQFGVGKSTLLQKMARPELSPDTKQQLLQMISRKVQVEVAGAPIDVTLEFFDTLGTEQRNCSLVPSIVRGTNICFLVYDQAEPNSFTELASWKNYVELQAPETLFFVLGNSLGKREPQVRERFEGLQTFILTETTDLQQILLGCVKQAAEKKLFKVEESLKPIASKSTKCC